MPLCGVLGIVVGVVVGSVFGSAADGSGSSPKPAAPPTVTVTTDPTAVAPPSSASGVPGRASGSASAAGPATTSAPVSAAGTPSATGAAQHLRLGDGTYVAGSDIPPGSYATTGGKLCYYAVLDSAASTYTSARGSGRGPQHASLRGGNVFQISGGCTWTRIG